MAKHPQDILATQAYHRGEWDSATVKRYEMERKAIPADLADRVEHLFRWFLTPITLWPINLNEFLIQLLDLVKAKRRPDTAMVLLLDLLPPLPADDAVATVEAHEHDVQAGHYENFVPDTAEKFQMTERELSRNRQFRQDWKTIQDRFDVSRYADEKGLIRRSLIPERNLRPEFGLSWRKASGKFQAVFDTFCAKWNLYGMQKGKPLLLKLTVNLTPFGTMIFVPAYWSFDPKRDILWAAVTDLHKSRRQHRQGKSLSANAEQRRLDAEKLVELDRKAAKKGLKGAALHEFLCSGLGWDPRTDPKRIARLRKLA